MTFYDIALGFGLLAFLPKILWRKKLSVLRQRLFSDPPDPNGRRVIWVHAVSVGEVKSAKGLIQKIKAEMPDAFLLATTATAAGFEEAKRALKPADAIRFMPLDFSWTVRKWVRALKPSHLLFVESDFWFQLIRETKRYRGKAILVSGKLSDRSARRFSACPRLAKKFFSLFDQILVQNEEYQKLFAPFAPTQIGGNLKLDALPEPIDRARFEPLFREPKSKFMTALSIPFKIAVVSTHAPEEEEILASIQSIPATIFLIPRHPERFSEVAKLLESKTISYCRWSRIHEATGKERVILVDAMGQVPIFYTFCDAAIVAGSFSSQIGGHNVLEPCLYGAPVFFGPHMHQQKELAARVLQAGAGQQVSGPEELAAALSQNLSAMRAAAVHLGAQSGGALERTWEKMKRIWE